MNEELHWNSLAASYEDEIFDVFRSDRNKRLPEYFRKHGNLSHCALDFGCGVGKAFPYLAPAFEQVVAVDISDDCLSIARTRPYKNISFHQADATYVSPGNNNL